MARLRDSAGRRGIIASANVPQPAPRVQRYLDDIVEDARSIAPIASLILFGSVALKAASAASDIDLIVVTFDDATTEDHARLRGVASRLEMTHGFRKQEVRRANFLERYIQHAGGDAHSALVCTKSAVLAGDPARIFNLKPIEALFVDRIVVASILHSGQTVYGQDFLLCARTRPIRRLDVFKSFFNIGCLLLTIIAAYPGWNSPPGTQWARLSIPCTVAISAAQGKRRLSKKRSRSSQFE